MTEHQLFWTVLSLLTVYIADRTSAILKCLVAPHSLYSKMTEHQLSRSVSWLLTVNRAKCHFATSVSLRQCRCFLRHSVGINATMRSVRVFGSFHCQLCKNIDCCTAMLLWQICVASINETYVSLHVKCIETKYCSLKYGIFVTTSKKRRHRGYAPRCQWSLYN